jgi:hypothetical protein
MRNERRWYKTASGALRGVVGEHRVYRGVLYFLNIIRVRGTFVYAVSTDDSTKSMASSAQTVTTLKTGTHYVQVPDTECQLIQNKYVKSTESNSSTPLSKEWFGIPKCSTREAIRSWTENQLHNTCRDLPGHRHGKLFIGRQCKKRADDLLKLGSHQLRMVVAVITGHATVRGNLYIVGLFEGDPTCRFCGKETETVQRIVCCCETLDRQRYSTFGTLFAETKDISTASVRNPCLYIRDTGLLNLC